MNLIIFFIFQKFEFIFVARRLAKFELTTGDKFNRGFRFIAGLNILKAASHCVF